MASTVNVRFTAEGRRQQILEVAMELFGQQGYLGTTTRHIAEAAGVNEAIIFRHFPTKEELYWEVLDRKIRDEQGNERMKQRLKSGDSHHQIFAAIGRDFLERRMKDPSVMRMLLFTSLENHKLSSRFFHTHIADAYETLADYIRAEIDAGRFRPVDPLLAARGFFGMFVYHFMSQELFGGKKYQHFDLDEVSETLTEIWLRGMEAEDNTVEEVGVERILATKTRGRSGVKNGADHSKTRNRTAGHATSALGNGNK